MNLILTQICKFFNKYSSRKKNGNEIIFKDSKIFYKDKNDELLFLSKISNLIFFIDKENLNNEMVANFEILMFHLIYQ